MKKNCIFTSTVFLAILLAILLFGSDKVHDGLHEKFEKVMKKKNFKKDNVEAGREYVEAYVIFIHYVEGLYETAKKGVHGHSPGAQKGEGHKH